MLTLTGTFVDASAHPRAGVPYSVTLITPTRVVGSVAQTSKIGVLDSGGSFSLSLNPGAYQLLINGIDQILFTLPNQSITLDVKDLL